jgi:orotidine-5'-phosphate decarboxylase
MLSFAERLAQAVYAKGNPVVVGLDPRADSLPPGLIDGEGPSAVARGYAQFCREVLDVVAPLVPAVKPQAAFFEQCGPAGMAALQEVIDDAISRNLVVILDGKRNDIGSTAEAYADAYLGRRPASVWGCDALTVNPYLGDDSLEPFVEAASQRGAGIFVLVKTSNPGSGRFQDLVAGDRPLYRHVAELVERLAQRTAGGNQYGAVGAVVGATYPRELAALRQNMPHAWLLLPGYGAQGATAADCAQALDAKGLGALVNSSRAILYAYARPEYRQRLGASRWQEATEAATRQMIAELQAARQQTS